MTVEAIASEHHRQQAALVVGVTSQAQQLWGRLDPRNLTGSWVRDGVGDQLLGLVGSAQLLAAATADAYVDALLHEQGAVTAAEGRVQLQAFAGVASDGRDLEPLMYSPVTQAKRAIGDGATTPIAMRVGAFALERIVGTQLADSGRAAVSTSVVAHPAVTGWVRMIRSGACGRCTVLAGRWYRWSRGFERHDSCLCVHVPAAEASGVEDLRTDPKAYFDSLPAGEQDRHFTVDGARAIRDGADISQVVNARRGAMGLSTPGRLTPDEQRALRGGRTKGRLGRLDVYGRQLAVTSEGTTVRGVAGRRLAAAGTVRRAGDRYRSASTPRLMPEAVYELADGDRGEAIRMLRRFGYITD